MSFSLTKSTPFYLTWKDWNQLDLGDIWSLSIGKEIELDNRIKDSNYFAYLNTTMLTFIGEIRPVFLAIKPHDNNDSLIWHMFCHIWVTFRHYFVEKFLSWGRHVMFFVEFGVKFFWVYHNKTYNRYCQKCYTYFIHR